MNMESLKSNFRKILNKTALMSPWRIF